MENEILYEGKYFLLQQNNKYPFIPGCYQIIEKDDVNFIYSTQKIEELARLEKKIRDFLLENNMQLVGIYKEEENGRFNFYIITYHIEVLKQNNINPDLYQPYIEKYLSSFSKKNLENVKVLNKKLKKYFDAGK